MNRIYQGRVGKVEIQNPAAEDETRKIQPWVALDDWEEKLWQHHALFQDAVNYYIAAIASLGSSPESPLTLLQNLLRSVWDSFEKNGQSRQGMGETFKRVWPLATVPTLDEVIHRFREPLTVSGVADCEMELAGEALLYDLGGDGAIQQGGRTYYPMFCQSGFARGVTFPRSAAAVERARMQDELPKKLWAVCDEADAKKLRDELQQAHFCILDEADEEPRDGKKVFADALQALLQTQIITTEQHIKFSTKLSVVADSVKPWKGTSLNKKALLNRFYAFLVCKFLCADSALDGVEILKKFYKKPKAKSDADEPALSEDEKIEVHLLAGGDDPIKIVRDKAGIVFRAFSALPIWQAEQREYRPHERSAYKHESAAFPIAWSEFDIAAFKEALKVYGQFKKNVADREEKLNNFSKKLLVMDGERVIADYHNDADVDKKDADVDKKIRARLRKIWDESDGNPKLPKSADGDENSVARFADDPRIERLRCIVNDDLAEEYRLTEGRKTPYGLRRRTMKGWGEVKREWQKLIVSDKKFSKKKQEELQKKLDELRSGNKREQIGSHKLFSALIVDDAAWAIWREPDDGLQKNINKNGWANDPLEAFREFCEIREALEEITKRPLRFTPANARLSRRLFMFTDVCSFGKDRGEFKHFPDELTVSVPVAIGGLGGKIARQTCKLFYSAPRLLRDGIRAADGAYLQDWTQPMMRALLGEPDADGERVNPQQLKDAAVQLMPDFDNRGRRRILLNFPLSLNEEKIKNQTGKAALWNQQFASWKKGAVLPYLRWAEDFDGQESHRWWQKVSTFSLLSADLGTRHTASVALLECGKIRKSAASRVIGTADGEDWFATFSGGFVLRLPGEDAQVLRLPSKLEAQTGKAFREELYGDSGRSADLDESQETLDILQDL
ncbi:MAG: type V CRISPR-associated protein Cas12b, partial [Verrucomicrobiales bacterium]|nr:type V CRISPR-associated protein Cas12b [Verrucomicrobiales bacterium]